MPINEQVQNIILYAAGGTVPLNTSSLATLYKVTGVATLTSSWTITYTGTPTLGTKYVIDYKANLDLNGNTLTIFGENIEQVFADKDFRVIATFNGTYFDVDLIPDILEDGVIPVTSVALPTNAFTYMLAVPISFELGEMGSQVVPLKQYGDSVKVVSMYVTVTKDIETTDSGKVEFLDMTNSIIGLNTVDNFIPVQAGTVAGSTYLVSGSSANPNKFFTTLYDGVGDELIKIHTSKTTPGGKGMVYLTIEKV